MRMHLNQHKNLGLKHQELLPASETDTIASCPYCVTFETSLKKELRIHINSVHGPCPPYKCNQKGCSYVSKKLYLLLMHLQIHSSDFKFKCNFEGCDFAATTVHKLKFHKSTSHNPNKHILCTECNKEFTTKASLHTHLEVVHAPDSKLKVR